MTHNDNGPGPGRNNGETAVFTFSRKVVFWPKMHVIVKKKYRKYHKTLIFILDRGTFFFDQLFPVVAGTWLELRSELFFGFENLVFGQKIHHRIFVARL